MQTIEINVYWLRYAMGCIRDNDSSIEEITSLIKLFSSENLKLVADRLQANWLSKVQELHRVGRYSLIDREKSVTKAIVLGKLMGVILDLYSMNKRWYNEVN